MTIFMCHISIFCSIVILAYCGTDQISPRPKIQQTLILRRGNKETQSEENIQKIQLW